MQSDESYYDEQHFQKCAFENSLGKCPTSHVANNLSTAYETAPSREGIFLRDFFRKRYKGIRKLIK